MTNGQTGTPIEKEIIIKEVSQRTTQGRSGELLITTIRDDEGVDYQTFSKPLGQWLVEKKYKEPVRIKFVVRESVRESDGATFVNRDLKEIEGYTPPPQRTYGGGDVFSAEQKARSMGMSYTKDLLVANIEGFVAGNLFKTAEEIANFIISGDTPEKEGKKEKSRAFAEKTIKETKEKLKSVEEEVPVEEEDIPPPTDEDKPF